MTIHDPKVGGAARQYICDFCGSAEFSASGCLPVFWSRGAAAKPLHQCPKCAHVAKVSEITPTERTQIADNVAFIADVLQELRRARARFPSPECSLAALGEEVGELCKAVLDEPKARVRAEAIQVAAMAARVALEGDPTLDAFRARKGLDKL